MQSRIKIKKYSAKPICQKRSQRKKKINLKSGIAYKNKSKSAKLKVHHRVPNRKNDGPGPGSYLPKSTWGTGGVPFGRRYAKVSTATPGPGAYHKTKTANKRKSKGCTFGRKIIRQVDDTPGPGAYNTRTMNQSKKRGCTFGKKITTSTQITPGPGAYNISSKPLTSRSKRGKEKRTQKSKSLLQPKTSRISKKTHSNGTRRLSYVQNTCGPGPGSYTPHLESTFGKKGMGFSIGKRLSYTSSSPSPGPGAYKSSSSNFCKGSGFSMGKKLRKPMEEIFPGPGQYNSNKSSLSTRGATISRQKKHTQQTIKITPGPGDYEFHTTFGKGPAPTLHQDTKRRVKSMCMNDRNNDLQYSDDSREEFPETLLHDTQQHTKTNESHLVDLDMGPYDTLFDDNLKLDDSLVQINIDDEPMIVNENTKETINGV